MASEFRLTLTLTERQEQIFGWLALGYVTDEIAQMMQTSGQSIRDSIGRARANNGCATTGQLLYRIGREWQRPEEE